MKVPFLFAVYTLSCTLTVTGATDPGSQAIESIMPDLPDGPHPQTIDVGTYLVYFCHYQCIVRYNPKPNSPQCNDCMEQCLSQGKTRYGKFAGYDELVKSAREKNIGRVNCQAFDFYLMSDTSWVMCTFGRAKDSLSREAVKECRKKLFQKFQFITPSTETDDDGQSANPYPQTVDVGTYIMHYCHYDCIIRHGHNPESNLCTLCITTCVDERMQTYRNAPGYNDKLVESARDSEKNIECQKCYPFHAEHILLTTWMMCNYPHRLENKFPATQEGINECREKLLQKFNTNLGSPAADLYPETVDAATYVMHFCHYNCIVLYRSKPLSKQCNACIKACLDSGKTTYHTLGDDASLKSAQEKNIECAECHDFDDRHMSITTWIMCNFPQRLENKFPATQEGIKECRQRLSALAKAPSITDDASYATHLCHHRCIFDEKYLKEPKSGDCAVCIQSCRLEVMGRISYEPAMKNARNKECLTCEKFDDLHMKITVTDICLYRSLLEKQRENSEECWNRMMSPYKERKKREHAKRGEGEVMRVMY